MSSAPLYIRAELDKRVTFYLLPTIGDLAPIVSELAGTVDGSDVLVVAVVVIPATDLKDSIAEQRPSQELLLQGRLTGNRQVDAWLYALDAKPLYDQRPVKLVAVELRDAQLDAWSSTLYIDKPKVSDLETTDVVKDRPTLELAIVFLVEEYECLCILVNRDDATHYLVSRSGLAVGSRNRWSLPGRG